MKKRILDFIASKLVKHYGELKYQNLFRRFYEIGINGMNYGNGAEFLTSGEMEAIKYAKGKLNSVEQVVIFDVGANIGNYSRAVLNLFRDENIHIYAFEPSKNVFAELTSNLTREDKVAFNNFGLGQSSSAQRLYRNENSSGLSSLYKRKLEHYNIEMNEEEEIKIVTLDDYCNENKIDRIDFLKIDVEGHEFGVLKGAKEMLSQGNIKFLQFEFGGTNIDSRIFFQDFFYLLKDRYILYRIVKDGLVEIKNYREEEEIFLTINYLAELKK